MHRNNPERSTTVWEVLRKELHALGKMRPAAPLPDDDLEFNTLLEDFLLCQTAFEEYSKNHRLDFSRRERQKAKERNREIKRRRQELAEEVHWAQVRVADYVYARSRANHLTALCLSGGGIRSATFGLGVLEGLAQTTYVENGVPKSLLHAFDYLSTVSGGGYIGSWFSSWVHRRTMPVVVHALQNGSGNKLDPDAEPVSFLREYSNYLNPKLGFTSADTWALVATVIRNILLNWLVLLPLIACVLALPLVLSALLPWLQRLQQVHPFTAEPLGLLAEISALVAFCCMCFSLPAAEIGNPPQKSFLKYGLVPAALASLLFTVYAVLQPAIPTDVWNHRWWCGIPVLAAFAIVIAAGHRRRGVLDWNWIFAGLLALAVSAYAFTWLTFKVVAMLPSTWDQQAINIFVTCSVPAVLLLIFAGIAILVGLSSFETRRYASPILDEDREWFARAGGWILIITFAWLLLAGIGLFGAPAFNLLYTAIASTVSGWVVSLLGRDAKTPAQSKFDLGKLPKSAKVKAWAIRLLLPAFVLLLLITLAKANDLLLHPDGWVGKYFVAHTSVQKYSSAIGGQGQRLVATDATPKALEATLALCALEFVISLVAAWIINVNKFSLHGMYKLRLIRAYLGASRPNRSPNYFTGFDPKDNLCLKDLRKQRPIHVINMALNLVGGKRLSWQQRKAASFTATPYHSGSLWWGYRPTKRYTDHKKGFTMGGAVTISGAAASPNMGYHSSPLLTIVMTLFNARLGAWVGNTGKGGDKHGKKTWQENGPVFGWRSFIDELFGLTNEDNKWIYLSDGGHFENLGIYEMVLRRCETIVAVDAGCDKDYTFEDLANAVRKIRIDLGVPIEFQDGVHIGSSENPSYHCAVGRILYSEIDGGESHNGWLLYIKSSMTGDEPPDVKQYQKSSPDFPHEATADQWFSESQFESYRALGRHVIASIAGEGGDATLNQFMERAYSQTRQSPAKPALRSTFE